MRNRPEEAGFTLIELLIIMIIMGVLAMLITGNFITSIKKGRDARRKTDIEQIQRALEMYYEDKGAYPGALTFGQPLIDPDGTGKIYMVKVPNDPVSGKTYEYGYSDEAKAYKLFACLENDQQVLPYESTDYSFSCTNQCKNQSGSDVTCVWGIASTNYNPSTAFPASP